MTYPVLRLLSAALTLLLVIPVHAAEWPAARAVNGLQRTALTSPLDQTAFAGWDVFWSPALESPALAYGPPVSVPAGSRPDELLMVVTAAAQVRSDFELLRATPTRRLTRYVFREMRGGLPVLSGRADLVLNQRGQIMRWSLRAHDHWPVQDGHWLGMADAGAVLAQSIGQSGWQVERDQSIPAWYPDYETKRLRPVYWVRIAGAEPQERWEGIVDAVNGEVVLDWPGIQTDVISGTIRGQYWQPYIHSDIQVAPHPFQTVYVNGAEDTTNAAGVFSREAGSTANLMTPLRGPYVNVLNEYDTTAARQITRQENAPYAPFDWTWTTDDATPAELNIYHHTLLVHDWFKALDPAYNALDYSMPAVANFGSGYDNAFWNGTGMHFGDGGLYSNFGMFSDIIYHEYVHGVTDGIYPEHMLPYRDQSGALNEAWSDYFGCTINGDPYMAEYILGGSFNSWFRNLLNTLVFPEDWRGEVHDDSRFISAALWTLRTELGIATGDSLAHYARYALAETFLDYLIAVLDEDDDDGDLSNGTPHSTTIYTAFGDHGVGPGDDPDFALRNLNYYANGSGGSSGDGDRFLEPGETAELVFDLVNEAPLYPPPATDVHISVHANTDYITVQNGEQEFAQLPPGAFETVAPILLSIQSGAPEHWGVIVIDVTANGGSATFQYSFEFTVGTPHLLIVEDDELTDVERFARTTLRAQDRIYDRIELPEDINLPAQYLPQPGVVLWLSGDARGAILTTQDQALLQQYLAQGNRVVLSGQNILDNLAGTDFLRNTLEAEIENDSLRSFAVTSLGDPFLPDEWFLLTGSGGAANQRAQTSLLPNGSSRAILYYGYNTTGPTAAVEGAQGRALLFGFGIEAISGLGNGSTSLGDFFHRLYNWADDILAVEERPLPPAGLIPQDVSLSPAYPNPFNSTTRLAYRLPFGVRAEFRVYDITGRLVESQLVTARNGELSWSPTMASGVYFAELRWDGGQTKPVKLLLLR